MARPGRWLLRLLLILIIIVVAAIALAPLVSLNPLKPAIESRLSSTLGRSVSVGSVRLNLMGGPYLIIDGMTAKEDSAFGEGNFLEADQVRANLALLPFVLNRKIVIEALTIKSPNFIFIKNAEGAWSWMTLGQPLSQSAASTMPRARAVIFRPASSVYLLAQESAGAAANIDSLQIEGASIKFVDKSGATPDSVYKNVDIQASITRSADAASAGSSRAAGKLRAQSDGSDGAEPLTTDMPFDLVIQRGAQAELSVQGEMGPGDLETRNFAAQGFKSSVSFKGREVALDQMEMNLYEGTMRGRTQIDTASQQFTTEGQVEHLNIDQALASKLRASGKLTGHINAQFKLSGQMRRFDQALPTITGQGKMSSNEMFIASVNVSENVARALQMNQVGDMSAGTSIGSIEAEFQIERGLVRISNASIQRLDGLGDATSEQGWLKLESSPTLDYPATVQLSPEATAQVKAASPALGAVVTLFQTGNRLAVPIAITGDISNPDIQVDVRRLFGF